MRDRPAVRRPLVAGLLLLVIAGCGQRQVFGKAERMYNSGHYGEAIQAFEPIAAGTGELAEKAQLYIGFANFKMGRHEQALRSFEELPARFPESEWADDAWYWAGRCYEDCGKTTEAITAYEKALETIPPSGKANMALRTREAIDMLEATSSGPSADTGGVQASTHHE